MGLLDLLGGKPEFFGSKEEPWQKFAAQSHVEAVDEDTGELVDLRPVQDDPNDVEGLLVRFGYSDVSGNASRRVILCWHCWRADGAIYVRGYCTLREALRTFRVDRMTELEELRTARRIDNPMTYFAPYATDKNPWGTDRVEHSSGFEYHLPSPEEIAAEAATRHKHMQMREQCVDGLRVLAYIALADGATSEAERNAQMSFVESRMAQCGFKRDQDFLDEMLEYALALAVPSRTLSRAVNAVAKYPDYYALTLSCARSIAGMDGTDADESGAIDKLLAAAKKQST